MNGKRICSYIEIPKTALVLCSVENYIPFSSVDANCILFYLVLYVAFITGWDRQEKQFYAEKNAEIIQVEETTVNISAVI